MKNWKIWAGGIVIGLMVSAFGFVAGLQAETPQEKGRRIMEQVEALPQIERMLSDTILDIYDATGGRVFSKKSRSATYIANFEDRDDRLQRSITYFYAPPDDKGNGALMIENPNGENDQWIYLKGLRKPKRVVGSDKSSSFMGSDFSNGDVAARDIDDAEYTWLATETVPFKGKNIAVEKLRSVFKDPQMREDYGYSKTFVWIHPASGLPFKMEMYGLNGQLIKTSRLLAFVIQKNKNGEKVFIPSALEMRSVLKGTKTIMRMENIRVEDAARMVQPEIFRVMYLTRKWW